MKANLCVRAAPGQGFGMCFHTLTSVNPRLTPTGAGGGGGGAKTKKLKREGGGILCGGGRGGGGGGFHYSPARC